MGAKIYVFWGGREGTETDVYRDPRDAMKYFRDAINFLCAYVKDQGYGMRFALEPKPNEPRGDLYLPTVGHALHFITTLDDPSMVGVNPEFAHETMAGINFVHGVAQAMEAGKLFHIDLNDQLIGRYDQDFRFASENYKRAFFLVKLLEDGGYRGFAALRCPCLPHRRRGRRLGVRPRLHALVPDPEGEGAVLQPGRGDPAGDRRARVRGTARMTGRPQPRVMPRNGLRRCATATSTCRRSPGRGRRYEELDQLLFDLLHGRP